MSAQAAGASRSSEKFNERLTRLLFEARPGKDIDQSNGGIY
jgi:hypothetical protein